MRKPVKDMFLDIVEEWENLWKDDMGFYDFLDQYVEINDDQHTYVVKTRKKVPEYF